MNTTLTEKERDKIIEVAKGVLLGKSEECKLLENMIHNANYNNLKKLRNQHISFALKSEENFLEGKKLSILIRDHKNSSTHDFKNMGTTENFPCTATFCDGVWEFLLPPALSLNVGEFSKSSGRFTGYLVKNLIENYEKEYGKIKMLTSPIVVFEYGIGKEEVQATVYDADNRDTKKALDALTGTFFEDDNVLSVKTFYYGKITDFPCLTIYVMESSNFLNWLKKGQ